MANMDAGRRENYNGRKFLIEDYKSIYKNIMKTSQVLKNYGVSSSLRDVVTKTYYDTDNMFFKSKGINISINTYKNRPHADLIIRYAADEGASRIEFLSDIPDTFIKKINKRDKIYSYYEYIANAVLELLPNGINVDALDAVRTIREKLTVTKKRDRYRVISSNGLKIVFSFEQSVYQNVRRNKVKLNILELRLDSSNSTLNDFEKFVHHLQIEEFRLIKVPESDLILGQQYLDI